MRATDKVWSESMPDVYERWLVPTVFAPFAEEMADLVGERPAGRILELAAGTGVLTRRLSDRGGRLVATDFNEAMVRYAVARVPAPTWAVADAMSLPFGDDRFDVVTCQFGAMFFPDKLDAFRETRRVLRPDGRLLFTTWAPLEEHGFETVLMSVLAELFPQDTPTFIADVPHGYADPAVVERDVRAAGFEDVTASVLRVVGEAPSTSDLAHGYCLGTPLRAGLTERGDLTELTDAVATGMTARLGAGPVRREMAANLLEAVR